MSRYYKPPIKSIIDKPEKVIPEGIYCIGFGERISDVGGTECPFLQWRKMNKARLEKINYDFPAGNTLLQYCSFLRTYLSIQDCLKDCEINDNWEDD